MPGVPGSGGPVPKPKDKKHGHISQEERDSVETGEAIPAEPLPPDPNWHPVAALWFNALAGSGQAVWYQASDWAAAYVLAETMSREFHPQPMAVGKGSDAHVEMVTLPAKSASIAAWLKGMTALLATEGDRRRMALELKRAAVSEGDGDVEWIDDARARLRGTSG